jgi:tetratricopeptide (TPR) repeat protein
MMMMLNLQIFRRLIVLVYVYFCCFNGSSSVADAFSTSSSPSTSSPTVPTATTTASNTRNSAVHELVSGDIAWNAYLGEADRSFRQGIQLEKNGQARKAASAFHEAATLYQCFLDSPTEFGHVTTLTEPQDCASILAYACLSLGFLNLDALENPHAAVRLYQLATDMVPTAVSYDGIGQSLEAGAGGGGEAALFTAIAAYRHALTLQPDNAKVQFHLAVALDRLLPTTTTNDDSDDTPTTDDNDTTTTTTSSMQQHHHNNKEEASALFEQLRRREAVHACLVDSWGYVRWHMRRRKHHNRSCSSIHPNDRHTLNLYRGTRGMLELALAAAMPLITTTGTSTTNGQQQQNGLVCEFGVGSGRTLRMTQEIVPLNTVLHGFDTFTGLPQPWGSQPAGAYSTGGKVPVMDNVVVHHHNNDNNDRNNKYNTTTTTGSIFFHKGLFRDTLTPFLQSDAVGPDTFLAYANIDCRLYSSTIDILEAMRGRIRPGTIILFSEYICHPTWRNDEFRAFRECCKRFGWKYEYLAFSLSTKQAVVRVTDA